MLIIDPGRRTYRANFHTHTTCSDGRLSPQESMAAYRREDYDILAITDHRKVTLQRAVPEGLLAVPGIELDFMLGHQAVHLLGLGVSADVAHRWDPKGTPQQAIDAIRACGGLAVLAHPAWSMNDTQTMASLEGLSAVEVWNSVSAPPYNADRADASALLDSLWCLRPDRLLPVMANDDTHFYGTEFASGWNMVQCDELTVPAVLEALRRGDYYATRGPQIHCLELTDTQLIVNCSPAERIVFYSDLPWVEGRARAMHGISQSAYDLQPGDRFVRVQVTDAQGRSAWSRPIAL